MRRSCAASIPSPGIRSASTGDIETIVPLYERFGADGVGRLEGMFGLAVWDDRTNGWCSRATAPARSRSFGRS